MLLALLLPAEVQQNLFSSKKYHFDLSLILIKYHRKIERKTLYRSVKKDNFFLLTYKGKQGLPHYFWIVLSRINAYNPQIMSLHRANMGQLIVANIPFRHQQFRQLASFPTNFANWRTRISNLNVYFWRISTSISPITNNILTQNYLTKNGF